MRRMVAAAIAMLAMAPLPAQAQQCWSVLRLDEGGLMFLDLAKRTYTEYRETERITPPAERNSGGYRLLFRLLLERDVDTGKLVHSLIVGEVLDPKDGHVVFLTERNATLDLTVSADGAQPGVHSSKPGESILLIADPNRAYGAASYDPAVGPVVLDRVLAGGTVGMRFRADIKGISLDGSLQAGFPANPAYQQAIRAKATTLSDQQKREGRCPLEHRDD